jgi:hypothetical protein
MIWGLVGNDFHETFFKVYSITTQYLNCILVLSGINNLARTFALWKNGTIMFYWWE